MSEQKPNSPDHNAIMDEIKHDAKKLFESLKKGVHMLIEKYSSKSGEDSKSKETSHTPTEIPNRPNEEVPPTPKEVPPVTPTEVPPPAAPTEPEPKAPIEPNGVDTEIKSDTDTKK